LRLFLRSVLALQAFPRRMRRVAAVPDGIADLMADVCAITNIRDGMLARAVITSALTATAARISNRASTAKRRIIAALPLCAALSLKA
jgi:hypothetical protein